MGLPWWLNSKESACQCRRHGFDPWVWKIPWSRKWESIPVFLPGEFCGQRSLAAKTLGTGCFAPVLFNHFQVYEMVSRPPYVFKATGERRSFIGRQTGCVCGLQARDQVVHGVVAVIKVPHEVKQRQSETGRHF